MGKFNEILIFLSAVLIGGSVFAKDPQIGDYSASVSHTSDRWVHYNKESFSINGSAVTDFGYFKIELGDERGEGRIFPELNIGGFGQVAKNPWKDYDGKWWAFNYGIGKKFELVDVKGGFGIKEYSGGSDCDVSGCKDIKSGGWALSAKVEFGERSKDNIRAYWISGKYVEKYFNPVQFHPMTITPYPLVQETKTNDKIIDLEGRLPNVDFEAQWNKGNKEDEYSMLIQRNSFSYPGGEAGIYPRFNVNNNVVGAGPVFVFGSQEGSLTDLRLKGRLVGVKVFAGNKDWQTYFKYTQTSSGGVGMNPQYGVDEKLNRQGWNLGFFTLQENGDVDLNVTVGYVKEKHRGDFDITDPALAFVVDGTSHNNRRDTRSWDISVSKSLSIDGLIARLKIKTIDTNGQFYTNPRLDEDGFNIRLMLERDF